MPNFGDEYVTNDRFNFEKVDKKNCLTKATLYKEIYTHMNAHGIHKSDDKCIQCINVEDSLQIFLVCPKSATFIKRFGKLAQSNGISFSSFKHLLIGDFGYMIFE